MAARPDLFYNRLTDFSLDEPAHAALRTAYLSDDVVVTPNRLAAARAADFAGDQAVCC
ncbi:protein of unknown function [Hyphomicrobium sp. 1Nfss2.1]